MLDMKTLSVYYWKSMNIGTSNELVADFKLHKENTDKLMFWLQSYGNLWLPFHDLRKLLVMNEYTKAITDKAASTTDVYSIYYV